MFLLPEQEMEVLCMMNERKARCMMKRFLCAVLALLLVPTVFAFAESAESTPVCGVDLNGNEVTTGIFTGAKLTVVNVWGTFCGPCIREMPDLGKLAAEYADRGVRFVGIICDVDETVPADEAKSIVEMTGAAYTHLLLNEYLYVRFASRSDYIPMTFLLDENGQELEEEPRIGSMSYDMWKSLIDSCLGK